MLLHQRISVKRRRYPVPARSRDVNLPPCPEDANEPLSLRVELHVLLRLSFVSAAGAVERDEFTGEVSRCAAGESGLCYRIACVCTSPNY